MNAKYVALYIAGVISGAWVGWALWGQEVAEPAEPYATPVWQADGSLIAERKPMTVKQASSVVKLPAIPAGATIERIVEAEVLPKDDGPVKVDMTIVRVKDDTHRVILSSPNGEIVGGVDVPVAKPSVSYKWAAGVVYGKTAHGGVSWGAFVDRDIGPVRIGVETGRTTYGSIPVMPSWETRVKVGVRW